MASGEKGTDRRVTTEAVTEVDIRCQCCSKVFSVEVFEFTTTWIATGVYYCSKNCRDVLATQKALEGM